MIRAIAFYSLVAMFLAGCGSSEPAKFMLAGSSMGTTWHITLVDVPAKVSVSKVDQAIQAELEALNQLMSTYLPDSELNRFNRAEINQWFPISTQTAKVIKQAIAISELSNGAFDVTVGPLSDLWGFGPGADYLNTKVPSVELIEQTKALVDYHALEVQEHPLEVRRKSEVRVDLSAIAKGLAVDELTRLLAEYGIQNYLVEIGGEIRASGHNPRGAPWVIGIERPSLDRAAPQQAIKVADRAVATSGDYRNYFEQGGKRYSHTIDPRTGYPVTHKLASVTVISNQAATADALATALLVLGPEKGLELAKKQKLAAFFIARTERGFSEFFTKEFEQYLQ